MEWSWVGESFFMLTSIKRVDDNLGGAGGFNNQTFYLFGIRPNMPLVSALVICQLASFLRTFSADHHRIVFVIADVAFSCQKIDVFHTGKILLKIDENVKRKNQEISSVTLQPNARANFRRVESLGCCVPSSRRLMKAPASSPLSPMAWASESWLRLRARRCCLRFSPSVREGGVGSGAGGGLAGMVRGEYGGLTGVSSSL